MKTVFKTIGIALLVATHTCEASTLLTFDELATPEQLPTSHYGPITNGYGGLSWNNFGVLDGSLRPANEGYHAGMVSPNNVAFNFYGEPASISVPSGTFDLESAYLTFALNLDDPLTVRVQGLFGGTVLYDNAWTVYRTAPTLVNFGYAGIDQVKFISSPVQQFAMDNLVVMIPEPRVGMLMLGAACCCVAGLKHRFTKG